MLYHTASTVRPLGPSSPKPEANRREAPAWPRYVRFHDTFYEVHGDAFSDWLVWPVGGGAIVTVSKTACEPLAELPQSDLLARWSAA